MDSFQKSRIYFSFFYFFSLSGSKGGFKVTIDPQIGLSNYFLSSKFQNRNFFFESTFEFYFFYPLDHSLLKILKLENAILIANRIFLISPNETSFLFLSFLKKVVKNWGQRLQFYAKPMFWLWFQN